MWSEMDDMKSSESLTRRMTYELSLPTVLTVDQLAVVSRIGKSEVVEASLNWFMALVAIQASRAGTSHAQAARVLVDGVPSMEIQVLPQFPKDGMGSDLMDSVMARVGEKTAFQE